MSLDTTPIPLLLGQLRVLAERMATFGWPTSPSLEPHPGLRPDDQPRATPQEEAAWAARAWERFAQEQANLLADFAASCKALGCPDPAGLLAARAARDLGAESEAVKQEVIVLFRLAAAGSTPALVAKMMEVIGPKHNGPVVAGVRLASSVLSAEAEHRGRRQLQGRDLSQERLSEAEKAIIGALREARGAALRGWPLASKAGYKYDYVRRLLPGLVRRRLVMKTTDGYTLPRD
jgi:hypothetical protein